MTLVELTKLTNVAVTADQYSALAKLVEVFLRTNASINLSSIRDEQGVWTKHIADALELIGLYPEAADNQIQTVVDVGCGGGFPVLPLAIMLPHKKFIALDSVAKKLKAVESIATEVGLSNVTTKWSRVEDWDCRNIKIDIVLARAVAHLSKLSLWVAPLFGNNTTGYFFKLDSQAEIQESGAQLKAAKLKIVSKKLSSIDPSHIIYQLKKNT
jgi:16S rRNA (guanine527-N7)-methyltransferase